MGETRKALGEQTSLRSVVCPSIDLAQRKKCPPIPRRRRFPASGDGFVELGESSSLSLRQSDPSLRQSTERVTFEGQVCCDRD